MFDCDAAIRSSGAGLRAQDSSSLSDPSVEPLEAERPQLSSTGYRPTSAGRRCSAVRSGYCRTLPRGREGDSVCGRTRPAVPGLGRWIPRPRRTSPFWSSSSCRLGRATSRTCADSFRQPYGARHVLAANRRTGCTSSHSPPRRRGLLVSSRSPGGGSGRSVVYEVASMPRAQLATRQVVARQAATPDRSAATL